MLSRSFTHSGRIFFREAVVGKDPLGMGVTLVSGWLAGNLIHPENSDNELYSRTVLSMTARAGGTGERFVGSTMDQPVCEGLEGGEPYTPAPISAAGNFLLRGPYFGPDGEPFTLIFGFVLGRYGKKPEVGFWAEGDVTLSPGKRSGDSMNARFCSFSHLVGEFDRDEMWRKELAPAPTVPGKMPSEPIVWRSTLPPSVVADLSRYDFLAHSGEAITQECQKEMEQLEGSLDGMIRFRKQDPQAVTFADQMVKFQLASGIGLPAVITMTQAGMIRAKGCEIVRTLRS